MRGILAAPLAAVAAIDLTFAPPALAAMTAEAGGARGSSASTAVP